MVNDMSAMVDFSVAMLGVLSDFLMSPPIFYLFGLILLCFVAKMFKILLH